MEIYNDPSAGFCLIGSMWLIDSATQHAVLVQYTAFISTTVLIMLFGFLMAIIQIDYKDVLSNTAVYAVILIVFVGVYLLNSV